MTASYPLTLLYDGQCPVCSLEMDHLRERSLDGRLVFVDITQPGFEAARYGVSIEALDAALHGLCADGRMLRGMPVLRLAYDAAGLGWALAPSGWPPLRPLFDAGYRVFARHRRAISSVAAPLLDGVRSMRARRTLRRMATCRDGVCSVDTTREGERS
jgi:predicted DCC family thiol-disulfide oxidoreductase YuxK